ncbi:MAG: DNA-binding protein [Kofleriaceae bacterium]|nr:DNA-binding protein [Kofleriaceae bacterium]
MAKGITYEIVATCCDLLIAAGITPTQRNVRAELPQEYMGCGNSTLVRHIRTWNEKRDMAEDTKVDLPEELVNAMKKAISSSTIAATLEKESQLAKTTQQIDEDILLLEANEATIARLNHHLNEQKEESQTRALILEKELSATTSKAEDLKNQAILLEEKLDQSIKLQEEARTELAKEQLRFEGAEKTVKIAQSRSDQLDKEISRINEKLSKSETQAATAIATSAEQGKTIKRLDSELSMTKSELVSLSAEYKKVAISESALKAQLEMTNRELTGDEMDKIAKEFMKVLGQHSSKD